MFKKIIMAGLFVCAAIVPGLAKNLAVPPKDPVATLTIPDSWKPSEIEFGYGAKSPDGDVFFSVEYATAARIDKLFATTDAWMKENKIKPKGKAKESEMDMGGLPAKIFTYEATDENGDTEIDLVVIPGGKGRMILLTLWGSKEEQEANKTELSAIQRSIKAIN